MELVAEAVSKQGGHTDNERKCNAQITMALFGQEGTMIIIITHNERETLRSVV
jgi:hypothetical protein